MRYYHDDVFIARPPRRDNDDDDIVSNNVEIVAPGVGTREILAGVRVFVRRRRREGGGCSGNPASRAQIRRVRRTRTKDYGVFTRDTLTVITTTPRVDSVSLTRAGYPSPTGTRYRNDTTHYAH